MKEIFIGIDFSKEKIDVSVVNSDMMEQIGYNVFPNDLSGYENMLEWIGTLTDIPNEKWQFCGENTGIYCQLLCNYLSTEKLSIWLENSLQIKRSLGIVRLKNDKMDSLQIAKYAVRFQDKVQKYIPNNSILDALQELLAYRNRLITVKNMLIAPTKER